MVRTLVLLQLSILLVPLPARGQCPGTPGTGSLVPRIRVTSDLWDSTGSFILDQGLPAAQWFLVLDGVPGPVPTPIGTVCVGLSPALSVVFDSLTGTVGFFCDAGGVYRFDADPASPAFMTATGFAATTVPGPDTLLLGRNGGLFVSAPSDPPQVASLLCVVDPQAMVEVATIPLTDSGNFLGFIQRGPLAESPSGRYVAVLSEGIYLPGFSTAQSVLSVVDADPASPTYLTELSAQVLPRYLCDDLVFDPQDPTEFTVYTVDSDHPTTDVYLTRANWASGAVTGTLLTSGADAIYPEGGVATTGNGNYVFAALETDETLYVLDAATLTVLQTLPLNVPGRPSRLHMERRP